MYAFTPPIFIAIHFTNDAISKTNNRGKISLKKLFAWKLHAIKHNNDIKVNAIKAAFSSFIFVTKPLNVNC